MRSAPNAGTAQSRRTSKGAVTSMTPPRVTFAPSSTLEREEVEAYSPTRYELTLDYLKTTRKCE
jgi:hypothetical protein